MRSRGVALALTLGSLVSACATVQKAAAQDPMKCEQDPNCAKGRSAYQDCTRQCVDDPQCIERCEAVQSGIDGNGGQAR